MALDLLASRWKVSLPTCGASWWQKCSPNRKFYRFEKGSFDDSTDRRKCRMCPIRWTRDPLWDTLGYLFYKLQVPQCSQGVFNQHLKRIWKESTCVCGEAPLKFSVWLHSAYTLYNSYITLLTLKLSTYCTASTLKQIFYKKISFCTFEFKTLQLLSSWHGFYYSDQSGSPY